MNTFGLDLPSHPVSDRISITRPVAANSRETWAELAGPGCIRHIWVTLKHPRRSNMINRKMILRIYFDGSEIPHVEAPLGDFFGVMHGEDYYEINCPFLSVKQYSGYNCYFEMPFAESARIELETGDEANHCYIQVDWHRYPGQSLDEPRRFCARWRKENPTRRYDEDYLMLDADGPGQLIGFVYGVRLMDNVDRWSHGGAENIYIDGQGEHPSFLRGIGGEDTFGTSYGGAHHPPESHLYASMPFYHHEDIGEARRAQRLVGYRFFVKDSIHFRESIHVRFGCMENNICSMVYWYQEDKPRPFVTMPGFAALLPDEPLARGEMDAPLPDSGSWLVRAPLDCNNSPDLKDVVVADHPSSGEGGWQLRAANHGFIDFNHVSRPHRRGAGVHHTDVFGQAVSTVDIPESADVKIRIAWDDHLMLQLSDETINLGEHASFRSCELAHSLKKGQNRIGIALSNTTGSNHGGWAFAFHVETDEGVALLPRGGEAPQ
jgi:hypothetical protein